MHARAKAIGIIAVLAASLSFAGPAEAAVSCKTVNKHYPAGISASKYAKNIGQDMVGTPSIRSKLYKKYAHLDKDKDKIVCELEVATDLRYWIATSAYNSSRKNADSSHSAPEDSVIHSENLPKATALMIRDGLSEAMSMWDERYGVSSYSVIAFTYKDGEWADQQVLKYPVGVPTGSWVSWIKKFSVHGDRCWLGSAAPKWFFTCMPPNIDDAKLRGVTAGHEYFHSIQSRIGLNHKNAPVWLIEGSATYFGAVVSNLGPKYNLVYSGSFGSEYLSKKLKARDISEYSRVMSEPDILEVYRALEAGSTQDSIAIVERYSGYAYGSLATELLIGTHGYEKFMNFLDSVGQGQSWKTSFYNHFGVTPDEFYVDVLEYLKKVY